MDIEAIREFVAGQLDGTEYYLVDLAVSKNNEIRVEIDSAEPVDIDRCVELTRAIEEAFPRDVEDYELEVGSAGLTSPFKVRAQYEKNIGNRIDVVLRDGSKLLGTLTALGDNGFTLVIPTKVRHEGAKRPVVEDIPREIPFADVKSAVYHLDF